ncbi:MAG: ABC transporter ATP-binding protein, partial [Deltaproteobacteria bacterium]|nr:ABC transporter ATP-binding protein [Deltaproteobacteria bacterium]
MSKIKKQESKRIIIKDRHKQLFSLIKDSWFKLFLAMLCMLVMAAANSAIPFLIKPVVDDIFINKDIAMLKLIPFAVIIIYFSLGSAYGKIQDLPLSFFHKEKTGVLISRITNDVNIIKTMVSTAVTGSLRDCFTIIGLTTVIFYRDWKMALFAFIVLPVAFFPIVSLGRRVRKVTTGTQESMAELTSFLHETFAGNKIVKAFGMEEYEKHRFFKETLNLFKLELKAVAAKALSSPVMEFLGGIGIAFVIWYGGSQVIAGTSSPGTFFSFMGAVLMLYGPVKKLSKLNNVVQQGLAATDRIYDILEKESDIIEQKSPFVIESGSHRVTFRNVFFKYDDQMVLKNINLDVRPGEILALVGMSGGGKTSLVNLIPRFYDVSEGSVLIDSTDIRQTSIFSLRKQIA